MHVFCPAQPSTEDYLAVNAPPVQFGLMNSPTTLECRSISDNFPAVHVELTDSSDRKIPEGRFLSLALENEGEYTCKIYFYEIGVTIDKVIQLQVLGE